MSSITMSDVAKAAKVSRQTVSIVLNGSSDRHRISETTHKLVASTAERLGYRKNMIARAMVTGSTNVIGLVGYFGEEYGARLLEGITQFISEASYSTKFFHKTAISNKIVDIARGCVEQRLSGVICRSLNEDELRVMYRELSIADIPIVLVDNSFEHGWCSRIISDDFSGEKQAVDHLYELGHRRIAHFTSKLSSGFARMRYDGFRFAMRAHDLELLDNPVEVDDQKNEITNELAARIKRILIEYQPTAVCCGCDALAMIVLKIATETGIKIPQELSVVGFAGLDFTQWTIPTLTTVKQPFEEMGKTAAEVLLAEIEQKTPIREVKLPVALVTRGSTAPVMKK